MKKCRAIFSILLLLLCLSFSGCTDKQQGDTADGNSAQDAPKDIVISDDTADDDAANGDAATDDAASDGDTADSDDSGAGAESGVTVEDSAEVPNTEVEFSE